MSVSHYIMENKEEIYQRYRHFHTDALYGEPTLAHIRTQFPIWKSYYGSFLPVDTKARILDAGCGSGGLIYWLQQQGFVSAEGVDVSNEEVSCAKTLGIKGIHRDDLRIFLSTRARSYDMIFILDVLEHFTKDEILDLLRLLYDALIPGGMLIIKTPNAEGFFGARLRYADFTHEIAFTESSLREVLSFKGFRLVAVREAGPVPHGFISFVRFFLWKLIRWKFQFFSLVETGVRPRVLTQNIIAVAQKQ